MVPIFKAAAAVILVSFYAIYFAKMAAQRRKGIYTDQIARCREKKPPKVFATELTMKIATYATAAAQVVSIVLGISIGGTVVVEHGDAASANPSGRAISHSCFRCTVCGLSE